jgi:hypothetical protein
MEGGIAGGWQKRNEKMGARDGQGEELVAILEIR